MKGPKFYSTNHNKANSSPDTCTLEKSRVRLCQAKILGNYRKHPCKNTPTSKNKQNYITTSSEASWLFQTTRLASQAFLRVLG